jgi:hypothetical protein
VRKYGAGSAAAAAVARVLRARDHYAVLGVRRGASEVDVKKAYRRLSLTLHPDRNHARDAAEAFQELSEAYTAVLAAAAAEVPPPIAAASEAPSATPVRSGANVTRGGRASPSAAAADAQPQQRVPQPPSHSPPPGNLYYDEANAVSGDGTPRVSSVRRRRRWERALGAFSKIKHRSNTEP